VHFLEGVFLEWCKVDVAARRVVHATMHAVTPQKTTFTEQSGGPIHSSIGESCLSVVLSVPHDVLTAALRRHCACVQPASAA
jgi:hypothetical protein